MVSGTEDIRIKDKEEKEGEEKKHTNRRNGKGSYERILRRRNKCK